MKDFIAATTLYDWIYSLSVVLMLIIGAVRNEPIENVLAWCMVPVAMSILHRVFIL